MSGYMGYQAPQASVKPRIKEADSEFDIGGVLLATVGSENVAEYIGGTPVGKVTGSGLFRPCFKTRVSTTDAAATTVEVDSALNAYVGDSVTFVDGTTGVTIATKTLAAVDKTSAQHTVTFAGAIAVTANDIARLNNGAETCVGILLNNVVMLIGPPIQYVNREANFMRSGMVYDSKCRGVGDLIKGDLPRIFFD